MSESHITCIIRSYCESARCKPSSRRGTCRSTRRRRAARPPAARLSATPCRRRRSRLTSRRYPIHICTPALFTHDTTRAISCRSSRVYTRIYVRRREAHCERNVIAHLIPRAAAAAARLSSSPTATPPLGERERESAMTPTKSADDRNFSRECVCAM